MPQDKPGFFRIVETDNFGGDYPDEKFATPYKLTYREADAVAKLMNSFWCDDATASRYWKVVPDGYQLQPGFQP